MGDFLCDAQSLQTFSVTQVVSNLFATTFDIITPAPGQMLDVREAFLNMLIESQPIIQISGLFLAPKTAPTFNQATALSGAALNDYIYSQTNGKIRVDDFLQNGYSDGNAFINTRRRFIIPPSNYKLQAVLIFSAVQSSNPPYYATASLLYATLPAQ